jgi:acyl carrier protein
MKKAHLPSISLLAYLPFMLIELLPSWLHDGDQVVSLYETLFRFELAKDFVMTPFEIELRDKLIEQLGLEDVEPETFTSDIYLFGEGLELDSVDAIEIEVMVKKEYGIDILTSERTESTFGTFGNLCHFIQKNRNRDV